MQHKVNLPTNIGLLTRDRQTDRQTKSKERQNTQCIQYKICTIQYRKTHKNADRLTRQSRA